MQKVSLQGSYMLKIYKATAVSLVIYEVIAVLIMSVLRFLFNRFPVTVCILIFIIAYFPVRALQVTFV
jgi:hypothetical protein